MDELERRVAERLTKPFENVEPPASLGVRVISRSATVRRRRAGLAAAAVAIVLIGVPVAVAQRPQPSDDRTLAATSTPSAGKSTAFALPGRTALADLIDTHSAVRVKQSLPGNQRFEAKALGTDGTVLGTPQLGHDENDKRSTGVWRAGPGDGTPTRVAPTNPDKRAYLWSMAVNDRGYLWPDGERLACLGPGGQGGVRTFPAGWGGRENFYANGPVFLWSDEGAALAVADSCGGAPRTLSVPGALVAFSYPHAFVSSDGTLKQVDVRGGETRKLNAAKPPQEALFAANGNVLVWAGDESITVLERGSQQARTVIQGLPHGDDPSYMGHLTVGERLAVYSAVPSEDDGTSASVVYDLRTGRTTSLPGKAWTAGQWLLWQDGKGYQLAKVKL
ncbi:hypothetical protein SMC26_29050 [Actinomadura fulvescens]|uniref:WD40 repeat domain-containing protein n=1 Tax=Actinomadura fulvescens TaxID=46160 RepID=A0ABP6CC52_9ACTN